MRHSPGAGVLGAMALLALVIAPPAAGQVFRCVVDGRVVYTDKPCAKGVEVPIEGAARSAAPVAAGVPDLQREANLGHVLVGMTARQVQSAWGTPIEKTVEQDAKASREEWSYERSGETVKVHFEAGVVGRISRTRATRRPLPDNVVPHQATVSELEDREREDKAGERRFLREGMSLDEVRGKLGPPSDRRFRATSWGTGDCWTYAPARRDPQTRTVVCFAVEDSRLVTIERILQRD